MLQCHLECCPWRPPPPPRVDSCVGVGGCVDVEALCWVGGWGGGEQWVAVLQPTLRHVCGFAPTFAQNLLLPFSPGLLGMWAGNTSNMHTPPGKGDSSTTGIFAGEGTVHCSVSLCAACEKCQWDHSVISVLGLPPEYAPDTVPRFRASRFWCRWMVRKRGAGVTEWVNEWAKTPRGFERIRMPGPTGRRSQFSVCVSQVFL